MQSAIPVKLGLGIGWRPELAVAIDRRRDLGFVELVAESLDARGPRPATISGLQDRGVQVVLHGLSLSLGSATPPEPLQLDFLAQLAERYRAPIVSEHIAFVRGGGVETGHLLTSIVGPCLTNALVCRFHRQKIFPASRIAFPAFAKPPATDYAQ